MSYHLKHSLIMERNGSRERAVLIHREVIEGHRTIDRHLLCPLWFYYHHHLSWMHNFIQWREIEGTPWGFCCFCGLFRFMQCFIYVFIYMHSTACVSFQIDHCVDHFNGHEINSEPRVLNSVSQSFISLWSPSLPSQGIKWVVSERDSGEAL